MMNWGINSILTLTPHKQSSSLKAFQYMMIITALAQSEVLLNRGHSCVLNRAVGAKHRQNRKQSVLL